MKEEKPQTVLKELIEKVQEEINTVFQERGYRLRRIRPVAKDEIGEFTADEPEPFRSALACDLVLYFFKQQITDGLDEGEDYADRLNEKFAEALNQMDENLAETLWFAFQCGLDYGELKRVKEYEAKHSRSDQKVWEAIYWLNREGMTDGEIAIKLNDLGYRKRKGKKFTREDVKSRRTSRKKNGEGDT